MAELKSIQDAARGMPLTVDSRMANEMHELNSRIIELKHDLKCEKESRHFWKFAAIVGLSYAALLMIVIFEYMYL